MKTGKNTASVQQALWSIWDAVKKEGVLVSFDVDPYDVAWIFLPALNHLL